MEVNFPRADESMDQSILLQQMVECQNELNSKYNDKLNATIVSLSRILQGYLEDNHPGQRVPDSGPHHQVVKNSFEEIALLLMQLDDMNEKYRQYIGVAEDMHSKMNSLDQIHKNLALLIELRLDFQRQHRTLTLRFQKLLDLAKKKLIDGDGDGVISGVEEADAFIGILKMGISFLCWRAFQSVLGLLGAMDEGWAEMTKQDEERILNKFVMDKRESIVEDTIESKEEQLPEKHGCNNNGTDLDYESCKIICTF